ERLKPYLPPGGITAAAQEVLRRLEREPVKVPINDVTITLGHEDFQRSPQLRTVAGPEFVLSLYHEHYDHWALMTYQARRSRPAAFPVIAALVDTSLGVTPRR